MSHTALQPVAEPPILITHEDEYLNDWHQIEACLSLERLTPYLKFTNGDQTRAINTYLWNLTLCESLYPILNFCEITLRNKLDNALSERFQRLDWYESTWLHNRDAQKIAATKQKLALRDKPITPGRVVGELTFGFWTSLLDVRYETSQVLWPSLAPYVFKYAPRKLRTRKSQSRYAAQIRTLRNRVFHHEPIWYWPNLAEIVSSSETWLSWLNPTISSLASVVNRFNDVLTAGSNCQRGGAQQHLP